MANFKNIFTLLFLSLFTVSLWGNLPCNKPECQAQNDCECTNPPNGPSGPGDPGGPAGPGGNGGSPGLPPSIAGGPGNGNSSSSGSGSAGLGSISVKINFGVPANENIDVLSHFSLYVQRPTPMMFSPQMLQYRNYLLDRFSQILVNRNYASQILGTTVAEQSSSVSEEEGGFGRITITNSLPSNVTHQVKIFTAKREMLIFEFHPDSSEGKQIDKAVFANYILRMVGADNQPVTTTPVYYDLYTGDGAFIRYRATDGTVISYHTASGRIISPQAASVGLEAIYDSDNLVRQIWSAADGLADVVVTEAGISYEIRFYSPDKVGARTEGLYTGIGSPHTVWRFENPNPGQNTKVKITKTVNGIAETYLYQYSHASEGWLLQQPGDLVVDSQITQWDYSETVKTVTTVTKTPDGKLASKDTRIYQKYPFGSRLVTSIKDPEGANLRTIWSYYTDSNNTGSYGLVRSVSYPTGNWNTYQYDAQGRKIQSISPWKNSHFDSPANQAKAEYYSYSPVDSRDIVHPEDQRPRMKETKILDITTQKNYYAYYFDNDHYVEVEEACSEGDAKFGASTNLRKEYLFYPKGECSSASAGRLHKIIYPQGTMDTYTYEYGTWQPGISSVPGTFSPGEGNAVRVKITRGTKEQPQGIANKTTQVENIYDSIGNLVFTATNVYLGDYYAQFQWTSSTFDELRRLTSIQKSNGELTEYTWNCCNKASETLPNGTQYTYVYDDLKRLISKTKVGIGSQPDLVTTYAYDAANRKIKETISGGDLSTTATWEYNLAGQMLKEISHQGLITTYAYTQGINTGSNCRGKIINVTNPGGFTTINTTYCDEQISAITGSAQVAEYYTYGINIDGSKWQQTNIGGSDSVRWQKETSNLIGATILQENSGYNGSIVQQLFYNNKNQLIKISKTGISPQLYSYDALGNAIYFGLDVNNNGVLDLESSDRIVNEDVSIDPIWLTKTKKVYGTINSSKVTTVEVKKYRQSDWKNNQILEIQEIDIHGNITTITSEIDRNNKKVITNIYRPESIIPEQTISINNLTQSTRSKSNLMTSYTYDNLERLIKITEPRIGSTHITYHTQAGKRGLKETVTDASGGISTYDYDSLSGRLQWVKNALGQYSRYEYNTQGKIIRIWGEAQYPIEFDYNVFGDMIAMQTFRTRSENNDPLVPQNTTGDLTTWTYDIASGLVETKTNANQKKVCYTYTVDGKVLTRTWARTLDTQELKTTYNYDPQTGELLTVTYSDDTPNIEFTYNRLGQLATIRDATGIRTYEYNSELCLVSEVIDGIYNKTISRVYSSDDIKGQVIGLKVDENNIYNYTFDDYGRINRISSSIGTASYTRLADSDLVKNINRDNFITNYSYESHRNLITQIQNDNLSYYNYTYNAIGNRTQMTQNGNIFAESDSINYSYNFRGEVTGAISLLRPAYNFSYTFDSIGNRTSAIVAGTSITYSSNALNQYDTIHSTPGMSLEPNYDFDGNTLTIGDWNYSWDGENRMIQAENGTMRLEFRYDFMGRRIEKKVYENNSISSHIRFVYDNFKVIQELDALNNNTLLRQYIWQPAEIGLDVPIMAYDFGQNTSLIYLTDANKNVTEIIRNDEEKSLLMHYEYSPFGVQTNSDDASNIKNNPFRFSSEYFDSETNLVYFNYRYYNPQLGRWMSQDPIGEQGGINLYSLYFNNYIKYHDALGLRCCTPEELAACRRALEKALNNSKQLAEQLLLYDEKTDQIPHYSKNSRKYTKPGGHYAKMKDMREALVRNIAKASKCLDCDDFDPPSPRLMIPVEDFDKIPVPPKYPGKEPLSEPIPVETTWWERNSWWAGPTAVIGGAILIGTAIAFSGGTAAPALALL